MATREGRLFESAILNRGEPLRADYTTSPQGEPMRRTRKLTITKVRRQTVTVTTTTLPVWCPFCHREVETLSEADAAMMLQIAGRMLKGVIDSGRLHLIEVGSGNTRICKPSIISV